MIIQGSIPDNGHPSSVSTAPGREIEPTTLASVGGIGRSVDWGIAELFHDGYGTSSKYW